MTEPRALTTKLICPAGGGTMIVRQQPATGHVTGLGLEAYWPLMLVSASPPYTVIALKYGVPATIPRGTWTCEWRNCMDAVQPGV